MPRWGESKEISSDSEYIKTIIAQVGPGAALAVLTLIVWVGFCFVQCCCQKPNALGYSRAVRLAPLGVSGVAALAFSIVGRLLHGAVR